MAEYIEREAVLSLAKDICVLTKWDSEYHHRSIDPCDVRELPAADVVPVRHGRWIWTETGNTDYGQFWICSECKDRMYYQTRYCPNCGALMDKDGELEQWGLPSTTNKSESVVIKPQTNADRIRAMSDEELAEFISGKAQTFGEEYEGYMSALDWLKEESD